MCFNTKSEVKCFPVMDENTINQITTAPSFVDLKWHRPDLKPERKHKNERTANQFAIGDFVKTINPQYYKILGQIIDINLEKEKVLLKIATSINCRKMLGNYKDQTLLSDHFKPNEEYHDDLFPHSKNAKIKISWVKDGFTDVYSWKNRKYLKIGRKVFMYKKFYIKEISKFKYCEFCEKEFTVFEKNLAPFEKKEQKIHQGFDNLNKQRESSCHKISEYSFQFDHEKSKKIQKASIESTNEQIQQCQHNYQNNIEQENIFLTQLITEIGKKIKPIEEFISQNINASSEIPRSEKSNENKESILINSKETLSQKQKNAIITAGNTNDINQAQNENSEPSFFIPNSNKPILTVQEETNNTNEAHQQIPHNNFSASIPPPIQKKKIKILDALPNLDGTIPSNIELNPASHHNKKKHHHH